MLRAKISMEWEFMHKFAVFTNMGGGFATALRFNRLKKYSLCSIIYNRQDMETAWVSTDGYVNKETVMDYYSAIKKEILHLG